MSIIVDKIIREYVDLNDRSTVRYINEVKRSNNENKVLDSLSNRLYNLITAKADKIDYGTIARSRGDITKIDKFEQLQECVEVITEIVNQYKQSTAPIDVISSAIKNTKDRANAYKRAYVINSPLVIMTYQNITLAIVQSVSYIIATCIIFITDPKTDTFSKALDINAYKQTMNDSLFRNLLLYNDSCANGELDAMLDTALQQSKVRISKEASELPIGVLNYLISEDVDIEFDSPLLKDDEIKSGEQKVLHDDDDTKMDYDGDKKKKYIKEFGIGYIAINVLTFIVSKLIPCIRDIVYRYYYSRQKISDYYAIQAELLRINAEQVKYSETLTDDQKKKVFDKQMKVVNTFNKIANFWAIDKIKSDKAAEREISSEYKQYNDEEIEAYANDSEIATSSLF